MKPLFLLLTCLSLSSTAAEVALDIGHSRSHPGTISAGGVPEWELNRRLAEAVAAHLRRRGIGYRLIGADGKMEVLAERTALAAKDSLFISLHHDSVQPDWFAQAEHYRGYSLFVSRKNQRIDQSLACAKLIGDRLIGAGFQPSLYHATPVKGENRPFADQGRGIHYYDGLAVLRTARQAAVLVEAGVVANPRDEMKVTGKEGRDRVARAIAEAVVDCLQAMQPYSLH